MKKFMILLVAMMVLVLAACGSKEKEETTEKKEEAKTMVYKAVNGDIEVSTDPKRVVILSAFAGNLIELGVPIVGADQWTMDAPNFKEGLKDAVLVSDADVEKIAALKPDLILGYDTIQNKEKIEKIAPTVLFTYNAHDYLQQVIEVGKVVNKEKEAQAWADDFLKRAQASGEEIKAKIGEDATVSVLESFGKETYVYGNNWGRGTEILYQAMGLNMPAAVEKDALKAGYYAVSNEVLKDYAGDYVILSVFGDEDPAFTSTKYWKEIPAVKNNQVYQVSGNDFYFNDMMTLDLQLDFFEKSFLGK